MYILVTSFILIKIKKCDGRLICYRPYQGACKEQNRTLMVAWLQELPRVWPRMLTNIASLIFVLLLSTGNFCLIFYIHCKLFGAGILLLFSICTALSKVGTGSTTPHYKQHQHHTRKKKSQNWALPHALNSLSLIPWNGGKVKPLQVMKHTFISGIEFTAIKELITQLT